MKNSKTSDLLEFAADLELLASSLGAGLQLDEASGYLTRHGSEVHRSHWQKLVSRLNAQLPLLVALHDFKVSAEDFWADQLCEIIITCEVYNSTLVSSEVVKLARSVRQVGDFKADSQRRLNAAKGVAWLALASPWILLLLLCGRPENREYFLEPEGIALLVAGGAASVASYFISKSIASIPITRRVFA